VEGSLIVRLSNLTMPAAMDRSCSSQWVRRKADAIGTCVAAFLDVWFTALAAGITQPSPDDLTRHARRALNSEDGLDDVDVLEPDPKNHKSALRHPRLAPFWRESASEEMDGLFRRGCFRKWRICDLSPEQRKHIFGSRFHHKIKRHTKTGKVKSLKIRLVVMGNNMTQGTDFVDAFAPVPRSTVGRILMAMAAAMDLEMHCVDFSQAFIQADWADLPEEAPQIFIRPPVGWEEESGVVYEVLRPLYGIPSSARALHYTLGCDVERDRVAKTLTLRQPTYIRRVLAAHGMTDCNPVKTPLETGTRLSARDCPSSPEGNRRRRHHVEPPVVFGQTQPPPWMG